MKLETLIAGRSGSIEIDGSKFRYRRGDGELAEGDFSLERLDAGVCAVTIGGRVYRVAPGAPGECVVNGTPVALDVFDPRALQSRRSSASSQGKANISAPMPGKVVQFLAAVGDQVEAGQGLVVVEAMKMQNEIKSPKTGRVAEVRSTPGSTVAAGQVLVVVE